MICHWHGGLPRFIEDLPSLSISYIAMVLWGYLFVFRVGSHVSLAWVELLVPGSPSWTNALEAL